MRHLVDVSIEELQETLDQTEEKTPACRLVAAIAYKHGITQSELAEWFGVERKTIYNWLTRLENRDLGRAIYDEHRSGRPRKLSHRQLEAFHRTLQHPPTEAGYDLPAWTTNLVQQLLRDRFETSYSRPSCRRLMKEAGLTARTVSHAATELDPGVREGDGQESDRVVHVWMPS